MKVGELTAERDTARMELTIASKAAAKARADAARLLELEAVSVASSCQSFILPADSTLLMFLARDNCSLFGLYNFVQFVLFAFIVCMLC